MSCYRPLSGFLVEDFTGKKLILKPYKVTTCFYAGKRITDWIPIPCGHCSGCAMDYAKSWSIRCQLEASLYPDSMNHFLTLTYDDSHNDGNLHKRDLQLFMKRLRKELGSCRFFAAGEFGSFSLRPHYHLLLFGLNIPDKRPMYLLNPNGLYLSDLISKLWSKGNISLGEVNEKSIGYTCRYCLKKVGRSRDDKEKLLRAGVQPEFTLMSRRPGIGAGAFKLEWFNDNYIPLNGRRYPINRFYIDMFEKLGFSYEPLRNFQQIKIDTDYLKVSKDEFYTNLQNKEIAFEAKLHILKKRNLDQHAII